MRHAVFLLLLNYRVISVGRLCGDIGIEGKRGVDFWF